MSVSHLHPLLTLYAMFLVSEVPKSDIWDLGHGGGGAPRQFCCNPEYTNVPVSSKIFPSSILEPLIL